MKTGFLPSLAFSITFCSLMLSQSTQVNITHLQFTDSVRLSEAESAAITGELEGTSCPSEGLQRCIAARVLNAFQEHGYFKAIVRSVGVKTPHSITEVEATVAADPGALYRIGKFEVVGRAVFDKSELQPSITVRPGDIFDVRKVRETSGIFRSYYTGRGYGNTTFQPKTSTDESKHTISFRLRVDASSESSDSQ